MTAAEIIDRIVANWDHIQAHGRVFVVFEADAALIDDLAAFQGGLEDSEPEVIEDDDLFGPSEIPVLDAVDRRIARKDVQIRPRTKSGAAA